MMARQLELLDGGLVTSVDPALLQPGELTQTLEYVYRAEDSGLVAASGLTSFYTYVVQNPVGDPPVNVAQPVLGLKAAKFQDGTHVLVASAAGTTNTIFTRTVASGGAFTPVETVGNMGAGPLNLVFYGNRYFMLAGVTANRLLTSATTTRRHGMTPVTSPLGLEMGTGTWSVPTDTFPGTYYYEYWYTEVIKYSDDRVGEHRRAERDHRETAVGDGSGRCGRRRSEADVAWYRV
jgi:hypothetical protein